MDSTYASTIAILRRIFQQAIEPAESKLFTPEPATRETSAA
jgi:hypothetical protein